MAENYYGLSKESFMQRDRLRSTDQHELLSKDSKSVVLMDNSVEWMNDDQVIQEDIS